MDYGHAIAWFFGGVFLMNAVPHLVAGGQGRPFQTPFATPSGEGLSSSTVNVLWGLFNLVLAWLLLARVGRFDVREWDHMLAPAVGGLLISLFGARHFGRFHGGNTPQ